MATSSGTTTTTTYVGDVEEVVSTQGSTPTTNTTLYYTFAGHRVAERVNGTLAYLTTDVLGSLSAALDGSGSVTASQLYAPYGGVRYSQGTLPTSYGFTGQRSDASTGLDAYGARYYDPVASQFASADTVLDGLNRYGYVAGNPETFADPSGHLEKPIVGDPALQAIFDYAWREEASGGDKSAMWALIEEAGSGIPTKGKWHYVKTGEIKKGLKNWKADIAREAYQLAKKGKLEEAAAVRARQTDEVKAAIAQVETYIGEAMAIWEASASFVGKGRNPPRLPDTDTPSVTIDTHDVPVRTPRSLTLGTIPALKGVPATTSLPPLSTKNTPPNVQPHEGYPNYGPHSIYALEHLFDNPGWWHVALPLAVAGAAWSAAGSGTTGRSANYDIGTFGNLVGGGGEGGEHLFVD